MNKYFFLQLLQRDIKGKYAGYKSMWIWVFIEPLIVALIMYTVFKGMGKADLFVNQAYSLYFFSGYFCWIFISMSIVESSAVYRQYSGIFKKVKVNLDIFPIVKVVKYFVIYIFLNIIGFIFLADEIISFSLITFIMYLFLLLITISVTVYVTSVLSVFSKELEELIKLFIRFGLWVLPVIWLPEVMSNNVTYISQLTPFYYPLALLRDAIGIKIAYGISFYSWLVYVGTLLLLSIRLRKISQKYISEFI